MGICMDNVNVKYQMFVNGDGIGLQDPGGGLR